MIPKKIRSKGSTLIGYATLASTNNIPITTTPSTIPFTSHEDIDGSVFNSISTNPSRIVFLKDGYYNINYSMEVKRVSGTQEDAAFWIRLNGTTAITNSTSRIHLGTTNTNNVITVPFTRYFRKNDYVEIMCHCLSNSDYSLINVAGSGTGANEIPNTPSVLVVVEGYDEY
jgi:hypothetical protein